MPSEDPIQDKKGNEIEPGDRVYTKIRGGKREGEVSAYPAFFLSQSGLLGPYNTDYRSIRSSRRRVRRRRRM